MKLTGQPLFTSAVALVTMSAVHQVRATAVDVVGDLGCLDGPRDRGDRSRAYA